MIASCAVSPNAPLLPRHFGWLFAFSGTPPATAVSPTSSSTSGFMRLHHCTMHNTQLPCQAHILPDSSQSTCISDLKQQAKHKRKSNVIDMPATCNGQMLPQLVSYTMQQVFPQTRFSNDASYGAVGILQRSGADAVSQLTAQRWDHGEFMVNQ